MRSPALLEEMAVTESRAWIATHGMPATPEQLAAFGRAVATMVSFALSAETRKRMQERRDTANRGALSGH